MSLLEQQPLSVDERDHLAECETIIEAGLGSFVEGSFVEVGEALAQVRDSRLYRAEFATFEDYCRERWNLTRQHVNRMVAASEAVAALEAVMEPIGSIPANEAQARPLAPLAKQDPEAAAQAWQQAQAAAEAQERPVTAADVTAAVRSITQPETSAVPGVSGDRRDGGSAAAVPAAPAPEAVA